MYQMRQQETMNEQETRALLPRILKPEIAVVEHFGPALTGVGPELEAGLLKDAVATRRAEFSTGRHCAREACRRIGRPCNLVGILPGRAPAWPQGVIGSITHCKGYVAAAVCRSEHARFLGIDAEPLEPLPEELIDLVAFGPERDWLLGSGDPLERGRLLFSIKEAVFKAWWPLHGSWLDFYDVTVEIDAERCAFRAEIRRLTESDSLQGLFIIEHGLIATAVFD
jgi:4'-phosphopantetheinyl transferase EntD